MRVDDNLELARDGKMQVLSLLTITMISPWNLLFYDRNDDTPRPRHGTEFWKAKHMHGFTTFKIRTTNL